MILIKAVTTCYSIKFSLNCFEITKKKQIKCSKSAESAFVFINKGRGKWRIIRRIQKTE